MERIAQALLNHATILSSAIGQDEFEAQIASIALQSVIPQDIENVAVEKIIKLRKKHIDEFAAFQTYIHQLAEGLKDVQNIANADAIRMHLDIEYQKNIGPAIEDLRKCMRSFGIETFVSAMNIEVKLGLGASFVIAPFHPVIATTGAIAFSVLPVLMEIRKERQQALQASPVAYLLRTEQALQPETLMSWVQERTTQFLFGK